MRYSSTDVYQHEMPGGQYTNLKFQAASLGLGDSWDKVQKSYAAANRCDGEMMTMMGVCFCASSLQLLTPHSNSHADLL